MWKFFGYHLGTKNPRVPLRGSNFVYQGGVNQTPIGDIVGGGNVPIRNAPGGSFQPVIMSRTIRGVGLQGMLPGSPLTLTPLAISPEITGGDTSAM